jgi:hypothetical protein
MSTEDSARQVNGRRVVVSKKDSYALAALDL